MKKRTVLQSLVCGALLLGGASLCYGVGTAVLSENFESGLNGWVVGDVDPAGSPAFWGVVTAPFGSGDGAAHGGTGMAYCAATGHGDYLGVPTYRESMATYLSKNVSLVGHSSAALSFWYKIPSIGPNATFRVNINDTPVWTTQAAQPTWTQVTLNLNAYKGQAITVTFFFTSDPTLNQTEGVYVDDIQVSGWWNLYWQSASGNVSSWAMDGINGTSQGILNAAPVDPSWKIATTGDLNNDGTIDLIWQNQKDGRLSAWLMDGNGGYTSTALTPAQANPAWKLVAAADFSGDNKTDLLFQHTDGRLSVWLMDGTAQTSAVPLNPGQVSPNWKIASVGEVNHDGQIEIVWQNTDGRLSIWYMDHMDLVSSAILDPAQVDPKWKIVGMADANSDGNLDLIWQHADGTLSYWLMQGVGQNFPRTGSGYLNPVKVDPAWRAVGSN